MKELYNTIIQNSTERIKNPFIGSFTISWFIFNWKSILTILLSDKKIEDRIEYVSSNYNNIESNLIYPIIFATIYVLVLPYLMWLIELLISNAKKGRKKNLLEEQLSNITDKQKIAVEENKYENIKASYAEVSELNKKIELLTSESIEKSKEIESLKIDYTNLKVEKNQLEQYINLEDPDITTIEYDDVQIAKLDSEYAEFMNTEVSTYLEEIGAEISQFKSLPNNTDRLVIEKFIFGGIIKRVDDIENQRVYYILTQKGKYFWKKYILSKKILSKADREKEDRADDLPF